MILIPFGEEKKKTFTDHYNNIVLYHVNVITSVGLTLVYVHRLLLLRSKIDVGTRLFFRRINEMRYNESGSL